MKRLHRLQLVLIATLATFCATADRSFAAELSSDQSRQIFAEANQSYQRGMEAGVEDPGQAKQEFETAARKYQTLLDSGVSNGKLYFNLANACLHSGQSGRAIANYERAARMMPGNSAVRANLQLARQQLDESNAEEVQSAWRGFAEWHNSMSPTIRIGIGVFAWLALWTAAAACLYWKKRGLRVVAAVSALVCILSVVSLSVWDSQRPDVDHGVVVSKQVVLRVGNGETFEAKYDQPVSEGELFEVVSNRGDWLHVKLEDGRTGWLPAVDAEVISANT